MKPDEAIYGAMTPEQRAEYRKVLDRLFTESNEELADLREIVRDLADEICGSELLYQGVGRNCLHARARAACERWGIK